MTSVSSSRETLLLEPLAPLNPVRTKPVTYVDRQAITIRNMSDLLANVGDALDRGAGFTLYTLNLDHLVKRRQSEEFRDLYARATFVSADGWPIVSLGRRHVRDLERTAGSDLVVPLCRMAALRAIPIALFGSSAAILDEAAAKLRLRCPRLKIVFCEAPPYGFDPTSEAGRRAMARIAASGARLCFVALGAPKQEIFSDLGFAATPQVGFVAIGAALDFIAGAHRRAPVFLQKTRLEWAWRLAWQPRRLGPRYLQCALLFTRLVLQGKEKPLVPRGSS